MDYEICFLVCGIRCSALGLQKALGCFLCEKSELFCFCEQASERTHKRARMPVTCQHARCPRRTPPRRSHTRFCFCTVITDILPYYKDYKRPGKWGGFFMVLLKNWHSFNLTFRRFSFVHMAIFVALHLGEPQDGVLTLGAVVVGLLPIVGASPYRTKLRGRVFFKARGHDGVQLLVLASVGHHFVGIRAIVVAFQTMEVAAWLLGITGDRYWKEAKYKSQSF